MKLHTLTGCLVCVLGLSTFSHAQAKPAASRSSSLQAGVAYSYAHPDYNLPIQGLTAYADYDFTHHLGVEGDMHFLTIITPGDIAEDTYLLGPRYKLHYGRFSPYVKALFGIGRFQYQYPTYGKDTTYTYGVYDFGGGVDVRASRHINVRAFDLEFQKWPSYRDHGLTPLVLTVGAAYTFR